MSVATTKDPGELAIISTSAVERERVYILYYRKGNEVLTKHFLFRGPLKDAIARGRSHCAAMGYSCMFVRPFIVDLEHQEKLKSESYEEFINEVA